MEIFKWDLEKVFVVRRCPLRTVRYIEIFLKKCPLEGDVRYREVSLY